MLVFLGKCEGSADHSSVQAKPGYRMTSNLYRIPHYFYPSASPSGGALSNSKLARDMIKKFLLPNDANVLALVRLGVGQCSTFSAYIQESFVLCFLSHLPSSLMVVVLPS